MVTILLWVLQFQAFAQELVLRCPVTQLKVGQMVEVEVQYVDVLATDKPTINIDPGLTIRYKTMSTAAVKENAEFKTITIRYIIKFPELYL